LDAGHGSPLRHLADVPLLHWHGDTFDLPEGAERLAETDPYANQAFRIGDSLLALQFHPEMGEDPRFAEWLEDEDYIRAAGTDPAALKADHDRHGSAAVAAGRAMLTEWLAQLPDAYD
jgi:GMP synthase (glutamine-hydrolysing)